MCIYSCNFYERDVNKLVTFNLNESKEKIQINIYLYILLGIKYLVSANIIIISLNRQLCLLKQKQGKAKYQGGKKNFSKLALIWLIDNVTRLHFCREQNVK